MTQLKENVCPMLNIPDTQPLYEVDYIFPSFKPRTISYQISNLTKAPNRLIL
jgi:hypothetical protein